MLNQIKVAVRKLWGQVNGTNFIMTIQVIILRKQYKFTWISIIKISP